MFGRTDCKMAPVMQGVLKYRSRKVNLIQLQELDSHSSQFKHSFFPSLYSFWNNLSVYKLWSFFFLMCFQISSYLEHLYYHHASSSCFARCTPLLWVYKCYKNCYRKNMWIYTHTQTNSFPLCNLCSLVHFWSKHFVSFLYPLHVHSHKEACTHTILQIHMHMFTYIASQINKLLGCLQCLHVNSSSINQWKFLVGKDMHKQNWVCVRGKTWNC